MGTLKRCHRPPPNRKRWLVTFRSINRCDGQPHKIVVTARTRNGAERAAKAMLGYPRDARVPTEVHQIPS